MPPHIEVELDIFSGMPNPTWALSNIEAASFVKQSAALPRTAGTKLSGNLGYRGFIVQVVKTKEADARLLHIQNGTVQVSEGTQNFFAHDKDRGLERWLLNTGKPHLKNDLFQMVEHQIR